MKLLKLKTTLTILSAFVLSAPVFAVESKAKRGEQELITATSPVYDELASLCMEAGITNFADSAPMTIQELKLYLKEVDYDSLSESGKAQYNQIEDYFNKENIAFKSGLLSLSAEPSVNFSGFYKTNDEIEWVYDRYCRQPFIDAPVTLTCGDYATIKMDVLLGMNKNTAVKDDIYSNIPYSPDYVDINFPDEAYFSTGYMLAENTGVNFQLGKGQRSIGRTLTGSMIWSTYLTGVSYGSLTLFSPNIRFTSNVSQFGVDRYMYYHQLDVRFFKKFTFTALEGMFINAPMELRFLNPLTIFHGFSPWRDYKTDSYYSESHICAYLGLKFQYVPVKNLRLYGLFAMTQFQMPNETSDENDVTPNGLGGQLGSEYYLPVKSGKLHFALEGSYAQPYLYIKEGPDWTLVRTYCENIGDNKYPFYEWIGSPFGPDTISGEFKVDYEVSKKYSVGLVYLFMARGEMSGDAVFRNMKYANGNYVWGGSHTNDGDGQNGYNDEGIPYDWCYPSNKRQEHDEAKRRQSLVTPSGTPEYVNRLSLRGSYQFTERISGIFQPSYVVIFNNDHTQNNTAQGIEIAAACSIKF